MSENGLIPPEYLPLLNADQQRALRKRLRKAHTAEEREELLQEAMLALAQGRNPDDGARAEERRAVNYRERFTIVSEQGMTDIAEGRKPGERANRKPTSRLLSGDKD